MPHGYLKFPCGIIRNPARVEAKTKKCTQFLDPPSCSRIVMGKSGTELPQHLQSYVLDQPESPLLRECQLPCAHQVRIELELSFLAPVIISSSPPASSAPR